MLGELRDIGLGDFGQSSTFAYTDAIQKVCQDAFSGNTKLCSIAIPYALSIEDGAFDGCTALKRLCIPNVPNITEVLRDKTSLSNLQEIDIVSSSYDTLEIGTTFSCLSSLCSLKMPIDVVKHIPTNAFYGTALTSLRFKTNAFLDYLSLSGMRELRDIDIDLFNSSYDLGLNSCCNLQHISATVPDMNTTIYHMFTGCYMHKIEFLGCPNRITQITKEAFKDCINLQSLDLSKTSITTVPDNAFDGCKSLSSISFGKTITSYGKDAFAGCGVLNECQGFDFSSIQCAYKIGDFSPFYAYGLEHTFDVIAPSAFQNLIVARGSSQQPQKSLQLTADAIGKHAFCNIMPGLDSLDIQLNRSHMPWGCFSESKFIKDISLGGNIKEIDAYAFYGCESLSSLKSSNAIDAIYEHAFDGCVNLKSAEFACNASKIDKFAFNNCQSLSSLRFSNIASLEIGENAFSGCTNLISLSIDTLPTKSFLSVGWNNIKAIYVNANIDTISSCCNNTIDWSNTDDVNAIRIQLLQLFFRDNANNKADDVSFFFNDGVILRCNDISQELSCIQYADNAKHILEKVYVSKPDISEFLHRCVIPSNVDHIKQNAFDDVRNDITYEKMMLSIYLNNTTSIEDSAFAQLPFIQYVYANQLTSVPQMAFEDCISLKNISLQNAQSIGPSAFYGCESLSSVESSQALKTIGDLAFFSCKSLASFPFEASSLECIGTSAFADCTALTSVVFNIHPMQIMHNAFSNCIRLVQVQLPQHCAAPIYDDVFSGCSSLQSISVHRDVQIQPMAFKDCNILCMFFIDQSLDDVIQSRLKSQTLTVASSSAFGSPKAGTKVFTNDNNFQHPAMIAVDDSQMYVSQDPSFILDYLDGEVVLRGIDPQFESSSTVPAYTISGVSMISSSAFNDAHMAYRIEFDEPLDVAALRMQDGAFSEQNAPTVKQLAFSGDCPSYDEWSKFFSSKLMHNDSIRAYFSNGYAQGSYIFDSNSITAMRSASVSSKKMPLMAIPTADIFIPQIIGSKKFIAGVHEQLTRTELTDMVLDNISSTYVGILPGAFTDTQAIATINKLGKISDIEDYAFRFNNSISSINIQTDSPNPTLCSNAFAECALREVSVNISKANGYANGISGYGLNQNALLEKISYLSNVSAIAPSAMVNCGSILTSVSFTDSLRTVHNAAFAEFIEPFGRIQDIDFTKCTHLSSIEDYAFYNALQTPSTNSTILSVPSSLKTIGTAAFAYDRYSWTQQVDGFKQMSNAGLLDIGPSAFAFNSFHSFDFPNTLTAIGDYAFAYPKYQYPLHIPSSVSRIGLSSFYKNVILNPVNIKKNIISVDVSFRQLSTIMNVQVDSEYRAENKCGFTDATIISATAPGGNWLKSFAYVMDNTMHFCPQNLSIDLVNRTLVKVDPSSVQVYVPAYLTCIGPSAFMDCTVLTSVSAHESLSIGQYAFYNCSALQTIHGGTTPNTFNITGDVTDYEFYNCSSLSNVYLLSTVPSIGQHAFYNCDGIKTFHTDETVAQREYWNLSVIDNNAFDDCSSLSVFDIPHVLCAFGDHVFKDNETLSNVNIDLEAQAFATIAHCAEVSSAVSAKFNDINTTGNTRINFLDITYMNNGQIKIDNEFIKTRIYDSKTALCALRYDEFLSAPQHYLNLSAISMIDPFVFNGISKLRSINVMPAGTTHLEEIGDYAFNNCFELMSINGGKLECNKIGCYAFANCEKLMKLKLSYTYLSSANCIGQGAFFGTSLNTLDIIDCPSIEISSLSKLLAYVKNAIGLDSKNYGNPLQLPDYCLVQFFDESGKLIGKYDCMMHDILHTSIDINRNVLTFLDKTKSSIRPLLLVKPVDGSIPAIAANTFHANIVGRWK